jgi:hypothetical protein
MISPQMKKQFGRPSGRWKESTTMNECFLRYREDLTGFRVGRLAASIEDDNTSYDFLKRRETFRPREGRSVSEKRFRFMLFVLNITVGMKEWFECFIHDA